MNKICRNFFIFDCSAAGATLLSLSAWQLSFFLHSYCSSDVLKALARLLCLMCGVGSRGGITQVKVAFMGNVKRTLVRNVKGPVRKNDILALLESEREARRLR